MFKANTTDIPQECLFPEEKHNGLSPFAWRSSIPLLPLISVPMLLDYMQLAQGYWLKKLKKVHYNFSTIITHFIK